MIQITIKITIGKKEIIMRKSSIVLASPSDFMFETIASDLDSNTIKMKALEFKGQLNAKIKFIGTLVFPLKSSNGSIYVSASLKVTPKPKELSLDKLQLLLKTKFPATKEGLYKAKEYIETLAQELAVKEPKWVKY